MSRNSTLVIRKKTEGIAVQIKWYEMALALAYEVDALEREKVVALRIANELTLETQTLEEAVTELVRLVHEARNSHVK